MKTIVVVLVFLTIAYANEWHQFKELHEKDYKSHSEERYRKTIFHARSKKIEAHNKRFEAGKESYQLGVNWFTDRTDAEIKSYTHGVIVPKNYNNAVTNHNVQRPLDIPGAVSSPVSDWRSINAISLVKDQYQCDSCWAFATTGAIESHTYIYHRRSVLLSEQNLVDCVTKNLGCKGGWPTNSMQYVKDNGGIDSESSYPYQATDNQCRYSNQFNSAQVSGVIEIPRYNETALWYAVAYQGPVAVCFDASGQFYAYRNGIYNSRECNPERMTHAVLAIGYGTENGLDYWICKNSWGPAWGENGFFRISRNANNMCGIATVASYPLV